ncbi:EamA family transporter [Xylophilus rhododendri]|uniref:EamA family transporter n=1 Tax=Xylophilus rhododendri TaxID=2697032 RepID=A0A857JBX9_9BURK|nr:DMT family transporter [Xylophilus rhododendri]QHJ00259.1 EamA family transporter [Xylophilus rhododendri]
MPVRLSPSTVFLLALPPLLWAANAVVGRLVHGLVPPMTLNLLRWAVALLILLPLAHGIFRRGSPLWTQWRYYLLLGLWGVGAYNSLQYLALRTSQPLNVTLVGSAAPVWMLIVGRLFFHHPVQGREILGAVLSMAGVFTVLARGDFASLAALRLVPGDFFILLASISWAFYSWMMVRPAEGTESIRAHWARLLAAQIFYGLLWSSLFTATEWTLGTPVIHWGWPLAATIAFVGVFPAVVAYGTFSAGVRRVGPTIASFFTNLTPLFAALLSAAFLGEAPHLYHAAAFVLIVAGIVVSSRR